ERLLLALEQARHAQQLEALVHADQELRRADPDLDRAELGALDHAWNGAELTRRIELRLDAAVGAFVNRNREALHPFVLGIVEGRGGDLDGCGFVLRRGAARQGCDERGCKKNRAGARARPCCHGIVHIGSPRPATSAAILRNRSYPWSGHSGLAASDL